MVGLTTAVNANAPEGKKISLFYNQTNQNLALEQRNEKKQDESPVHIFVSPDSSQTGFIENPSQIAAAGLDGLTVVFGFTTSKPDKNKDPNPNHDVSILSPVYTTLSTTLKSNKCITAVSHDGSVSVFYLVGGGGQLVSIEEQVVGDSSPLSWDGATGILEGSSLAAYRAEENTGDTSHVIYQAESKGHLYDYVPDHGNVLMNDAEARSCSPLAVVVANKKAYLYFANNNDELCKVVKSNIADPNSWGSTITVKGGASKPVNAESQITVVATDGMNHIFYSTSSIASNIVHVTDKW